MAGCSVTMAMMVVVMSASSVPSVAVSVVMASMTMSVVVTTTTLAVIATAMAVPMVVAVVAPVTMPMMFVWAAGIATSIDTTATCRKLHCAVTDIPSHDILH